MKTSKYFYKHIRNGKLYVIELAWDGSLIGSCCPDEELDNIDYYELNSNNNNWIQENNNEFILFGGNCGIVANPE